jgi:ribonuclease HII
MPNRIDPALIPDTPDLEFESQLWKQKVGHIAGLDEAGRGAWAGPVFAAAVILAPGSFLQTHKVGIRDSKQLTPARRGALAPVIKQNAADWGIGNASSGEIDEMGILPATRLAMMRALGSLKQQPKHLLIDALFLPDVSIPQTALIKGDQRSLSIAAASILAKTARDEWMIKLSELEPCYHFACNKGYGTRAHLGALIERGPCTQHRFRFAPIRELLKK